VKTHEWNDVPQPARVPHKPTRCISSAGHTTWDADGRSPRCSARQRASELHTARTSDGLVDEGADVVDPSVGLSCTPRPKRLMLDRRRGALAPPAAGPLRVNKRANFQALSSEQLVGVWMSLKGREVVGRSIRFCYFSKCHGPRFATSSLMIQSHYPLLAIETSEEDGSSGDGELNRCLPPCPYGPPEMWRSRGRRRP